MYNESKIVVMALTKLKGSMETAMLRITLRDRKISTWIRDQTKIIQVISESCKSFELIDLSFISDFNFVCNKTTIKAKFYFD